MDSPVSVSIFSRISCQILMTKSLPASRASLGSNSIAASMDTPDQTLPETEARPAHYQAGQDAYTALTKFANFIGHHLQPSHIDNFPKHKKICEESLVDASITEDRSVIKRNLGQFREGLTDLAGDLKSKLWKPDLSAEEYTAFEGHYDLVEYLGAKFEALALNPNGCTEILKVDDTSIEGYGRKSTLCATVHTAFS